MDKGIQLERNQKENREGKGRREQKELTRDVDKEDKKNEREGGGIEGRREK